MGTSVLRSIVRQNEMILYESYATPPLRVALLLGRISPLLHEPTESQPRKNLQALLIVRTRVRALFCVSL
jgi:hypothetical protein